VVGPIEAVIADVGGVLCQLREAPLRDVWARRLGLDTPAFSERVWEAIGTVGAQERPAIVTRLAVGFGIRPVEADSLLTEFHAHWDANLPLLRAISDRPEGLRAAVLSNAGPAARFAYEDVLRLHELVDEIVISCEIGVEKPEPAAYRIAAARLGVPADRCLFVDDLTINVRAARVAGMQAFAHRDTPETIARISEACGRPTTSL
jgi:HAD superfamily hydrolase (TIGR01509 family)